MRYTYIIDNKPKEIDLPNSILKNNKKILKVYGDSFCNLDNYINVDFSWLRMVGATLSLKIESYGIPGAAESTIFYTYLNTIQQPRDYTIIFHTHPTRTDRYFNLPKMFNEYDKWDTLIKKYTPSCLHIYWSTNSYTFYNGKVLYTDYWMKDNGVNEKDDKPLNSHLFKSAHHMTLSSNKKLSKDVINIIKGELI